jgi:hypothetical protein
VFQEQFAARFKEQKFRDRAHAVTEDVIPTRIAHRDYQLEQLDRIRREGPGHNATTNAALRLPPRLRICAAIPAANETNRRTFRKKSRRPTYFRESPRRKGDLWRLWNSLKSSRNGKSVRQTIPMREVI